jgi:hypothetical protein
LCSVAVVARGKKQKRFFDSLLKLRHFELTMDVYLFCIALGFCGLVAMALLGVSHGHGGHAHGGHGAHGKIAHQHQHGHGARDQAASPLMTLLVLLSPRILFSVLLGFGATGFLLRGVLPAAMACVAALAGAWIFERWMVQPLWRFLFNFVSAPAQTLENVLLDRAEAVTNFDSAGQGLVAVQLDGQVRQMLATLESGETKFGARVRAGDEVWITAVDARRNSCTVTRLATAKP